MAQADSTKVEIKMERRFCYHLEIGKTVAGVCHHQGECEQTPISYCHYTSLEVRGWQGLLLPLIKTLTKVFAGYRTFFSPFMQEPAEKLLKYKTKQLNYINVHEATCPEANRFHRFHVLPVLICSREMKTMYHL